MASSTLVASQLPPPAPCETQSRPVYNFPPELWRDRIASITFNQEKLEWYEREVEMLKSEVEAMLKETSGDAVDRIKLIYSLSRLGISYHYQAEIERQLHQIFDLEHDLLDKDDYDLHTVAVVFQIFRQHGIKMSCDIFNKFKDSNKNGGKFKDSLASDPRGLLSLFEATHLATHGEEILDEALAFTRTHLEERLANQLKYSDLGDEIASSLTTPLHRGPPRLKAREFISFYEKCHQSRNDTLLKFAKLDFNRIQLLHQQEIKSIFEWSIEQDLQSKLPFARDRIMEYFFWGESIYFEPKYAYARAEYIKQCHLVTFLDDVYDTYGAFHELPILTDAIERWDRGILGQLPRDYMKHLYKAYLDCFDELENHAARDGTSMGVSLTRDYLVEFAQNYMLEAEWIKSGYVPSFKESLKMGVRVAGERFMHAVAFMGMGDLAVPAFQWLQNGPALAHLVCVIARLRNELVSYKRDEASGNSTYPFYSYKRENKASDEETVAEFHKIMSNSWKTVNEELMRESANLPLEILMRVINFGRLMEVFYKDRDAMTDGKYAQNWIKTLYFDPIPFPFDDQTGDRPKTED